VRNRTQVHAPLRDEARQLQGWCRTARIQRTTCRGRSGEPACTPNTGNASWAPLEGMRSVE
jgi:hypothetical protein